MLKKEGKTLQGDEVFANNAFDFGSITKDILKETFMKKNHKFEKNKKCSSL